MGPAKELGQALVSYFVFISNLPEAWATHDNFTICLLCPLASGLTFPCVTPFLYGFLKFHWLRNVYK